MNSQELPYNTPNKFFKIHLNISRPLLNVHVHGGAGRCYMFLTSVILCRAYRHMGISTPKNEAAIVIKCSDDDNSAFDTLNTLIYTSYIEPASKPT